jgi:alpha-L-rhamnosidase
MPLTVCDLRVEYSHRPTGVHSECPSLSWRIDSDQFAVKQSAYRILVASSEATLLRGVGDLWDSSRVESGESFDIRYGGRELVSRQRCWWRVQVWTDAETGPSVSDVSWWEMGLLSVADWGAHWLAAESSRDRADRQAGLRWVWGPNSEDVIGSRKFRWRFQLPAAALAAELFVGGGSGAPALWLDGEALDIAPRSRFAFGPPALSEIDLGCLAEGEHVVAVEVNPAMAEPNLSATPIPLALFARTQLVDGRTQRFTSGERCRTSSTGPANWCAPDFDDTEWAEALPSETSAPQSWPPTPAMLLRSEFILEGEVSSARLYVAALGACEARLNGNPVDDSRLAPEISSYSRRVLYRVHDVTAHLRAGLNAIGLTVGDGWYASRHMWCGRFAWGPPPRRVLAQLEVDFGDGSVETITTANGWRIAPSEIVRSELYDGETVDARLAQPGWDMPGFDDKDWEPAQRADAAAGALVAQTSPPIRATQVLKPRALCRTRSGAHVIDFGQNVAGWCRLRTKGPAGTRIELRFAETLRSSGQIDQSNLREAKQTDVFILSGLGDEEVFEPRFTYHGFRYVEVSGLTAPPTADSLEAIVIHSDLAHTGSLRVENSLVRRIWENTLWSQRSNFVGVQTDCPQRDERLCYLSELATFCDAAAFNMDVAAFMRRQVDNVCDSQYVTGAFPPIAPAPIPWLSESMQFVPYGNAVITVPWTMWRRYGDITLIDRAWEHMLRYVEFIASRNPDHIWTNGGATIGDWLCVGGQRPADPTTDPPDELLCTAYWARAVDLLAQMAEATEHRAEYAALSSMHSQICRAFERAFVSNDGQVGNGVQGGYVLALAFDLVPGTLVRKAAAHLADDIRERGIALATGTFTTEYLLDVLADTGYVALAFDLLKRIQYPSWGYMVENGATTMWEGWDGKVWASDSEKMPNSYNHTTLGAVSGFLFRRVAGIDAAQPGFKVIRMRPFVDAPLARGGGDYKSIMGTISTDWSRASDGHFNLRALIPPNTCAQIHLPAGDLGALTEGGESIEGRDGFRIIQGHEKEAVVEAGSGVYEFEV